MAVHNGPERPFRELWPLLAVKYGMVTAGVLAWLWAAPQAGLFAAAVLLSAALAAELPLYAPGLAPHARGAIGVVQLACTLGAFCLWPSTPAALVAAAVLGGLAAAWPWRWTVGGFVLASAVSAAASGRAEAGGELLGILALYVLAVASGRLFTLRLEEQAAHRAVLSELEQAQERLARFTEASRELAAAAERQRLAEELHDTLGHALVATLLQVQVARKQVASDPRGAEERLAVVEQSLRQTLEQVRTALRRGRGRRSVLPLHLALESLGADFEAAGGLRVVFTFRPDAETVSDVSDSVRELIYHTTQEALTNAVRHGRAQTVRVELEAVGARLYLRITDDGVGAAEYTPGLGLAGMVRRVQELDGTLRFQTAPGAGFQVEVGVMRR